MTPLPDNFHGMIGHSAAMKGLFGQLRRIADADGPVLLSGESGTGKELAARAVHAESRRRDRPFVAVNCAGIPSGLLESELFGHSAGAFTGAHQARKGLFSEADGGTLLLDEIGEMPAEMQVRLLRILEGGWMRPVGDNREQVIDVRVIAATNRDLEADVEHASFRSDLFFRLETFSFRIPPLRERPDDIEPLASQFITHYAEASGRRGTGIMPSALARLQCYPFPGNVRELSNAMERAVICCRSPKIDVADLPERIRNHHAGACIPPLPDLAGETDLPPLKEIEQRYIQHVLSLVGGNKQRAATTLGIGRRTLYRYLKSDQSHG